jgi:hypothetical protein
MAMHEQRSTNVPILRTVPKMMSFIMHLKLFPLVKHSLIIVIVIQSMYKQLHLVLLSTRLLSEPILWYDFI